MISTTTTINFVNVLANGVIQVQRTVNTLTDGVITSYQIESAAYFPGQDISFEDSSVQTAATAAWTSAVVSAYSAAQSI